MLIATSELLLLFVCGYLCQNLTSVDNSTISSNNATNGTNGGSNDTLTVNLTSVTNATNGSSVDVVTLNATSVINSTVDINNSTDADNSTSVTNSTDGSADGTTLNNTSVVTSTNVTSVENATLNETNVTNSTDMVENVTLIDNVTAAMELTFAPLVGASNVTSATPLRMNMQPLTTPMSSVSGPSRVTGSCAQVKAACLSLQCDFNQGSKNGCPVGSTAEMMATNFGRFHTQQAKRCGSRLMECHSEQFCTNSNYGTCCKQTKTKIACLQPLHDKSCPWTFGQGQTGNRNTGIPGSAMRKGNSFYAYVAGPLTAGIYTLPSVSLPEKSVLQFNYYMAGYASRIEACQNTVRNCPFGVTATTKNTSHGWKIGNITIPRGTNVKIMFVARSLSNNTYIGLDNLKLLDTHGMSLCPAKCS